MEMADAATQGHCALNPVSFEEKKYTIKKADTKKKIAIVGGGIGGMETARLCAMMGHTVDLYEKTDRLGGVFIAAAAPDFKEKDKELIEWYRAQILKLPVNVHMNTEIKSLNDLHADEIVIATGSKPRKLNLPGFELGIDATEYLLGTKTVGNEVAVIGGGLTGCEIAYDLALKGKKPFIVEMTDDLVKAAGVCAANSECLRDLIRFYKIPVYLESSLKQINQDSVIIKTAGGEKQIPCESVVLSVGYVPNAALVSETSEHVHVLGDAAKVGNLKSVIWGAYELAFSL
jgi:2-enoate reductase